MRAIGDREVEVYFEPDYFAWQAGRAECSARVVVPLLVELVHPECVVDVGCGTGAWLQVFGEHGVRDVLGVDGQYIDPAQLRIPRERFQVQDLTEPLRVGRTFDLALSLEVAHYLPPERAAGFVASLAGLAPVVLFSAAVPHQTGGPGQNRQWPHYWCDLFAGHGFEAFDWLRPQIWEDERVDWWYAQNAILFVRQDRASDLVGPEPDSVLPLVHPKFLLHCLAAAERPSGGLRGVARKLWGGAKRTRRQAAARVRPRRAR